MQSRNILQRVKSLLFLFFSLLVINNTCFAQEKWVEMKEMKDTVNLLVSTIKELEKQNPIDMKKMDAARTRITVLVILNTNGKCGSMPPPSATIELIELYWKCLFDTAYYGKKFVLNY
jgi:hypothetical protein